MMSIDRFQLYLLSRMRAEQAVGAALQTLGASRVDAETAREEMLARGVETPGHVAALYSEILGNPISIEPVDAPPPFAGSKALRFRLPLWPAFNYIVHEDLAGAAWSPGFARAQDVGQARLLGISDLAPWGFTLAEVVKAFGAPLSRDGWTNWEDLVYEAMAGTVSREHVLRFDFNLLQLVEIV